MTVYIIRKVQFKELDSCTDVIRQSFATVAEEFGLTVQNCPTNGAFLKTERLVSDWHQGAGLYGLYFEEELAGFMELKEKGAGAFELEKLSVLPQHRHKGGGTLLLDFAHKEISRTGGNKILIGIIESNLRLKEWYLKYGFVHTGTKDFPHLPFTAGFMEMQILPML